MTATARTNLELSADQDLSITFTGGDRSYLTKDSVVVAMRTDGPGWLVPGSKLPYEQAHSEEPFGSGTSLGLQLVDCEVANGQDPSQKVPDEALLPAGEYLLYGKVQAELVRGGEVLGSGTIWTSPARILIPEQPELPTSDS